ncbi:hypothetical protein LXA43DRAFT_1125771 [Ganoderma leucocontextum]|nr:hypothetical protein LXA43DRAFT_1125771 [Ganoderma leucocontextum]
MELDTVCDVDAREGSSKLKTYVGSQSLEAFLEAPFSCNRSLNAIALVDHVARVPSLRMSHDTPFSQPTQGERQLAWSLEARQISVPTFDDQTRTFEFECFSSLAMDADVAPLQYKLSIGVDGSAACSCPDVQNRGVVCKHLRAALVQLATLHSQGICIPNFSLPTTYGEARTRFHARTPIVCMPQAVPLEPREDPMDATSTTPDPLPVECLPVSVLSTRRTAQVVEDIVRESGDIFDDPGDRRSVGRRDAAQTDSESTDESSDESDADSSDEEDVDEDELAIPSLKVSSSQMPQEPKVPVVAREGVVRQAVARVLHELEEQMRENLEGIYLDISEIDCTRTAKGHLDALSSQLSRMLLDAAGDSHTILLISEAVCVNAPASFTREAPAQAGFL